MAYCSPFLGVFRAKIEKHLSLALCNTTRITVPPVHCYECLWGVTVQQRIQDIRGLSEWILVWSVDRAEWDLTLALIRPLGCACKGAHCLPALCFSKRESGKGLSLSSVEHKRGESLNEEEKKYGNMDVTERCSEGPMSNTLSNVAFYMVVRCFHPVASVNDCSMWSKSGCYKWIRGYFSLYYFCILAFK